MYSTVDKDLARWRPVSRTVCALGQETEFARLSVREGRVTPASVVQRVPYVYTVCTCEMPGWVIGHTCNYIVTRHTRIWRGQEGGRLAG